MNIFPIVIIISCSNWRVGEGQFRFRLRQEAGLRKPQGLLLVTADWVLLFEIQMLSEVSWRLCFLSLLPLWLLAIVENEGYDGTNVGFRLFSGPVVVFMVAAGSPSLFSQYFASSTVPGTGVVAVVAASRGDTPCCTCNTREYASSRSWSPLPSPCPANPCNPCSRFSSPCFMLEMVSWCGLVSHRGFCSQKQWVSSVCVCACAH